MEDTASAPRSKTRKRNANASETTENATSQTSPIVLNLKEDMKKEVQEIVSVKMPSKIAALTDLIKTLSPFSETCFASEENASKESTSNNNNNNSNNAEQSQQQPTSSSCSSSNPLAKRAISVSLMNRLKQEIQEMLLMIKTIKLFITLTFPAIKDAHGFDIGVQTEILTELTVANVTSHAVLDSIFSHFFESRANILRKVELHPTLHDYTQSLHSLDEVELSACVRWVCDLVSIYSNLHDIIHKNMAALTSLHLSPSRPRSAGSSGSSPPVLRRSRSREMITKRKRS